MIFLDAVSREDVIICGEECAKWRGRGGLGGCDDFVEEPDIYDVSARGRDAIAWEGAAEVKADSPSSLR